MSRADRPWWEGGAAVLSENWAKGMVACYHPIPDRIFLDAWTIRCAWCNELHDPRAEYWPATTPPERLQ